MMNPNQAQFGGSFQQPTQPQQKGCVGRNWKWALPVGCLGLILIVVAGGAGIFYFAMSTLKSSEVYKGALERARANPAAVEALGEPIKDGWLIQGNINFSGGSGNANLQIPVSGPKKSGTLVVRAVYENGAWMYETLDLAPEGGGVIPLLDRGSAPEVESLDGSEDDSDVNDPSVLTDNGGGADGQPAPPPPPAGNTPGGVVISGGVLNGKAISKPQPAYPPAAKAARASGTVTVQVTVDEEGNVIEAAPVSGHPLLQAAAVAAARQAKFSPTLLSGKPVKVKGILTYNFVLDSQ